MEVVVESLLALLFVIGVALTIIARRDKMGDKVEIVDEHEIIEHLGLGNLPDE